MPLASQLRRALLAATLFVLLSSCAPTGPEFLGCETIQRIRSGQTIQGRLSGRDCDYLLEPADYYVFDSDEDEYIDRVTATVTTATFWPTLTLYIASNGEVVGSDDGSPVTGGVIASLSELVVGHKRFYLRVSPHTGSDLPRAGDYEIRLEIQRGGPGTPLIRDTVTLRRP